uniref:ATP synthase complex subunit 8 n=1 Tax=Orectochilus villosus TaxID=107782 RepID=A0A7U3RY38_9COLE|nr:ATP synthase F0 subunit 8 [Orectochilus villosus]
MPQMAPMNWLILFIIFNIIFFFVNFLNYYIFLLSKKSTYSQKTTLQNMLNWKW